MTAERTRRARFVAAMTLVAVAVAVTLPLLANRFLYHPSAGTEPSRPPGSADTPAQHTRTPDVTLGPTAVGDPPQRRSPSAITADPTWVHDRATRTGVPLPAMRAYASAVLHEQQESPGCGLTWSTLAAIGSVETHHGTIEGRIPSDQGRVLPRVIGLPLDGRDVAAITDSDGGQFDGDKRWDRAVGPMQFIPQTWLLWAIDGDSDGTADPDDLDDATATAARYLCADGNRLSSHRGWIDAVASYNHNEDYVRTVAEEANRLASS